MKKLLFCILLATGYSATAQSTSRPVAAAADSVDLTAYVGTYRFAENGTLTKLVVTVKGSKIYGQVDSNDNYELLKQPAADTFKSTSSYGSLYTFTRDAERKVTGFKMEIMGNNLTGTRE